MSRVRLVVVVLALTTIGVQAQFKPTTESRTSVTESIVRSDNAGLLFGWFDPSRLIMNHTYSFSYMNAGGRGLSVGMYTNSLYYKFSDPLDVQFDISLMHSPFNSMGNKNDLSGIFLSRAQLNYRPTENMLFQIQYRQLPPMYWLSGVNRYSSFFEGVGRIDGEER